MSILWKVLRKAAAAIALLLALTVAGAVIGWMLLNRFRSEDAGAPSRAVAVVGVWDRGGDEICRAFDYGELLPHLDTLTVRFALDENARELCRSAFASYDAETGWARRLRENEMTYEGFRFEMDRIEPDLRITLTRYRGDAVSTTTRYRVLSDGAISDIRTKGTGPGSGLALVLGAMPGIAVWVVWVLWSLLSFWWSLRRARLR